MKKSEFETWLISKLRPFPNQALFGNVDDETMLRIARSMGEEDMTPIEILPKNRAGYPAGTILRGHQRLRAAKHNGMKELLVKVRYDLADADRKTIERAFIRENLDRRHMDTLAQVRAAFRLWQLTQHGPDRPLRQEGEIDARVFIAKEMRMSPKNAKRYLDAIKTPMSVQNAFSAGKLSLVLAARIGTLPKKEQQEIGRRIASGEDATQVAREYFSPTTSKGGAKGGLADMLGALKRDLREIKRRTQGGHGTLFFQRPLLEEIQQLVTGLLSHPGNTAEAKALVARLARKTSKSKGDEEE